MDLRTRVTMRSEKGPVRQNNEDCLGVLEAPAVRAGIDAIYIVADGLGGHERGADASAMAVDLLLKEYGAKEAVEEPVSEDSLESSLARTLCDISQAVYEAGLSGESMHRDPHRAGMATTATVALLSGGRVRLGHVGDSRAYLLREGQLTQMTEDHTLAAQQARAGVRIPEEARAYMSNALTQAVGLEQPIVPFTDSFAVEEGDRLLLCSDGLHGFLDDETIASIVLSEEQGKVVDALIARAIDEGSTDNITIILVSFERLDEP